jgi:hypothetical protein
MFDLEQFQMEMNVEMAMALKKQTMPDKHDLSYLGVLPEPFDPESDVEGELFRVRRVGREICVVFFGKYKVVRW